MDINDLIDKAKTRANLPSDYALAKVLGIKNGVVTHWRKGRRHPSNGEAVQLAVLAGMDEMMVIAEIERMTAKTEEKREFWKAYIEKRGVAALASMWILAASITASPDAEAVLLSKNYAQSCEFNKAAIYIMRI